MLDSALAPGHRRWALACLAGLLNGSAFIDHGSLSLIANVPLLWALTQSRSATESAGLGALVGFLGGVHIYGVLNYGWFLFLAFSLYTASQMVVYALLFRLFWSKTTVTFDVFLPAICWSLTEWIRTVGPFSMPASYVGNLADVWWFAPWLFLAPLTGGLGVSFVAALGQSILFHLSLKSKKHARPLIFATVFFVLFGLMGSAMPPPMGDESREIAAVQGGLANFQYEAAQADHAMMRTVVKTYGQLSYRAYDAGVHWAIWPETAVRAPVLRRPELQAELFPPADSQTTLIAGVIESNSEGQRFNTAAAIHGGRVIDVYRKNRLVPGTENHFVAGTQLEPIQTPHGDLGVMICLESVYGTLARSLTASGAQALVVMSNDAGFGWSPITRHMTNRARVRALENGRWLIRVGQAGVSAIIDPRGRIVAELGLFEPGILQGTIQLRTDKTPYVKLGNWPIWLIAVALLWLASQRIRRRRSDSASLTI